MPTTDSGHLEANDGNELDDLDRGRITDEEAQIGQELESSAQIGPPPANENHESETSSGRNQDEDALWRESLKAETGYTRYIDYLTFCAERHLVPWGFTSSFDNIISGHSFSDELGCAIVDIQDENSACCKLTLRCTSTSGREILSNLRQPSATTTFRIVLWDSTLMNESQVNALGLGLKVHPKFFHALLARHPKGCALPDLILPIPDNVVVMGQYVMTVIRNYLPQSPSAAPIILIATVHHERRADYDSYYKYHELSHFQELAKQAAKITPDPLENLPGWKKTYLRSLESGLNKARGKIRNDMDVTFDLDLMTAMLQFCIPLVRLDCGAIRTDYLHDTNRGSEMVGKVLKGFVEERCMLRRMIEDSEDNSLRLRNHFHSIMKDDTPHTQWLMNLDHDLQQIHLKASRLEAEIRDYLQLQAGEMALQESRKSIELSNFQIEEAKRVKIFTILAFVYVPLNLATSIFGMNIEQLNGSGQRLSKFIATAVVTLAVTGGSWFVIEQVNSYGKWRKRRADTPYNGKTQFALVVRIVLLVFLISNGYTQWMLKSGAWWRILLNQKSLLQFHYDPWDVGERLTAGEYVSKYSTRDLHIPEQFFSSNIEWIDGKENEDN